MSSQTPPSSHSGDPLQPINPYEPSRSPEVHATDQQVRDRNDFQFNSRLDWSDRRALLQSVGPMRVIVVCTAILWIKGIFEFGQAWTTSLNSGEPMGTDAISLVAIPLLGLIWILEGLLVLYLCWLDWGYAKGLQAAAGGRTRSWHEWSGLHYRTARLGAVVLVLDLLVAAGNWLIDRYDAMTPVY